jgi:type IV pilus assembly protein PilZ
VKEQRGHTRVPIAVPVTCKRADGSSFEGKSRDISLGGMFVEASHALPFNTELNIECELAPKGRVSLPAVVRWSKPDGFGVQFGLLGARETHLITQLTRRT